MTRQQIAAIAAIGIAVYAGSRSAGAPPARNWDVRAIWQPATVTPPVAVPVPPVAVVPPVAPPVQRQTVVTKPLPQIVAPRPIVREARRQKPRPSGRVERVTTQKPPQQRAPDNAEAMPSCAQVCAYTRGKSYGQLLSEAANYNPSPRLRAHGIACYARCK